MPVKRITQSVIRALKPPATGNTIVWDSDIAGFGARITSAGTVAFVLNYTLNGRERRYTIGKYPDWSPSAAREEAIKIRGDVSRGEDPLADEPVDGPLIAAENERRKRPRGCGDLAERFIQCAVGQDGQNRPEDFLFHDPLIPAHRIDDGRVQVAGIGIRLAPVHDLLRIDEARKPRGLARAHDLRPAK